jgi:Menaquinone biosynthesis
MKMKSTQVFTLGHSPDPDDALMFYAMAENKIDLRRYRFDHRLPGIQTLNERARRGRAAYFRDLDSRARRASGLRSRFGGVGLECGGPPRDGFAVANLTPLLTVLRRMKLYGKNKPHSLQTPIRSRR